MSIPVFRGPLINPQWNAQWSPSWMIRPEPGGGVKAPPASTVPPHQVFIADIFPQPYWPTAHMYRPPAASTGTIVPKTTNIFYKPLQPTVGHLGFLGMF
jgi:hypothetical protein